MRDKGDGHAKQRANGSWEWQFWYEDNDETMVRKSVYGKTKAIAKEKYKEFLKKVKDDLAPTEITFVDYLYQICDNPKLANTTHGQYKLMIRNYVESLIPKVKLVKLKNHHIKKIYKTMEDKGLSESSRTVMKTIMGNALKKAVIESLITINPMHKVADHPTQPKGNPNPLEMSEQERLLATETKPEYKNIWTVAIDTGLRRGELFGLKWSDIDYDRTVLKDGKKVSAPVIKIQRQYQQRTLEFAEPKRGSVREVALLPTVAKALESQWRIVLEKKLKARLWVDNNLIFTNEVGEPKSGNKTGIYLSKRLKELQIKHRRFHDLRATFATNCMRQGVNIKTAQKWLGHADIKTTLNIYSASTPDMEVDDANKMGMMERKVS